MMLQSVVGLYPVVQDTAERCMGQFTTHRPAQAPLLINYSLIKSVWSWVDSF